MFTKNSNRGQALILIVLAIVGLVGMTALAVDSGSAYSDRRNAQSAADSAALSGALAKVDAQYTDGKTTAQVLAAIQTAAEGIVTGNGYPIVQVSAITNGYQMTGPNITVTMVSPPAAGCGGATNPYAGNGEYVQIMIQTDVDTYFGPVVGIDQTHNCVEAISHVTPPVTGSMFGGTSMATLAPTGTSIYITGGANVTTHNSGVFSNSSGTGATAAFEIDGGSTLTGIGLTGTTVTVVPASGGYSVSGGAVLNPATVTQGATQFAVPPAELALIPGIPTGPTCPHGHAGVLDTVAHTVTHGDFASGLSIGSYPYTFESGTYCITGNLQIGSGADVNSPTSDVVWVMRNAGDAVTLDGGGTNYFKSLDIYTINGGLSVTNGATLYTDRLHFISSGTGSAIVGGGSTVSSLSGVKIPDAFFYLTGGKPNWDNGAIVKLHAPSSPDPFTGMLVYMPWSNTQPVTFAGGTGINLYGTIMVPHSAVLFSGGTAVDAIHSQVIAYTITINGGAGIDITYNLSENFGTSSPPSVELVK